MNRSFLWPPNKSKFVLEFFFIIFSQIQIDVKRTKFARQILPVDGFYYKGSQ